MRNRHICFVCEILFVYVLGNCGRSAQAVQEKSQSAEYGAVLLVCRAELHAVSGRVISPLCVSVPPDGGTPESLLSYLPLHGIAVDKMSACYPRGELSRGLEIRLRQLKRSPEGQLEMTVETGDLTFRPGIHFAEALRFGTYRRKQNEACKWTILNYTGGGR